MNGFVGRRRRRRRLFVCFSLRVLACVGRRDVCLLLLAADDDVELEGSFFGALLASEHSLVLVVVIFVPFATRESELSSRKFSHFLCTHLGPWKLRRKLGKFFLNVPCL